ncbi:MAG: XrtA-associated tyrosine autokinase, partial [Candidatus Competibacteraceae bacterium]|nr:XrtA-associated tyrosine autokinase [Candidatus Competibacteraceae bacterium]
RRSATLDLNKIRQAGMVVPDTKRSRIKEEYRHIKRPLLMNAAGKGASVVDYSNLIMVTSASPGEGKTFTAINLALSIASERDRTVLLVDADVVKPSVSKFFGVDTGLGLVDFLIDESLDLSEVLVETNIPSLSILPAGSTHHLSTELLSSENMRDLAHEMSRRYPDRIVVFDSPPLLATTEARVLAALVGQVVMVVEAESTQQVQVEEALALLDPETIIGFVLNKTRHILGSGYYRSPYYYYGYGYGYGYQYGDSGRD